jgi:hypothetical protein
MSSVVIAGDTSGSITLDAPAVAGTTVLTLPSTSGNLFVSGQSSAVTSGTAIASTSGTSIDFTGIPSWVKRITVMFNSVSTNGTSNLVVQLGDSGGVETTGYLSYTKILLTSTIDSSGQFTAGVGLTNGPAASNAFVGFISILNIDGNAWVITSSLGVTNANSIHLGSGNKTLSSTLDRVRITTSNGTDTFDAGSINILYE